LPLVRSRGNLIWAAGLTALVILTFSDLLFLGRALYFRDIVRTFVPARVALRDALAAGEMPVWNPRWFAGQPMAANPMYEAFYPVQLRPLLVPDAPYGFGLEFVLHIAIAATGMFFFLRSLDLPPPVAAFGAVSFAFGGVALSFSNLPTVLAGLVWYPWLA